MYMYHGTLSLRTLGDFASANLRIERMHDESRIECMTKCWSRLARPTLATLLATYMYM